LQEWYEAKQVKGPFANVQSQATPPATIATATAQRSTTARDSVATINGNVSPSISPTVGASRPGEDDNESTGMAATTKIVLAICVAIAVPIVGYFFWFVALRDTWELNNTVTLTARLEEADRLQQSDAFAAYKIYDAVLNESRKHNLKDEEFVKRLGGAEKSRTVLYQKVQAKIRAEEAEKERQADAQAQREIADKERLAKEEQLKQAAEESQRLAEENRLAEQKRRKEAGAAYRNAPESARVALNAVKKLAARVEVGVNYADYSSVVGGTWGDVKIFIESADGKKLSDFTMLLTRAIADYKLALEIWRDKIRYSSLYEKRSDVDVLQQACWMQADACIELAEGLLDGDDKAKALEIVASSLSKAKDLDAEWKQIKWPNGPK
jgi:hypothetical protein